MAMSVDFIPKKESRQSIYDRLRSKPNPLLYCQKVEIAQIEIEKLTGKGENEAGIK